jgi:hypothetical protein
VPVLLDGRSALLIFVLLVVLVFVFRRLKLGSANALYSQGGPKTEYARPNDPPAEPERWPLAANAIYRVWLARQVDVQLDLPAPPPPRA